VTLSDLSILLFSTIVMKCFVSALALLGVAAAAPQYIADTADVQEAKIAFAEAFNRAARGSAIALQEAGVVTDPKDRDYSNVEEYVHVEVPAEPYVHIEPICDADGNCEGVAPAPVQKAAAPRAPAPVRFAPAPVQQAAAPVQQGLFNPFVPFGGQQQQAFYANNGAVINPNHFAAPVAPVRQGFVQGQFTGTCYNNLGEGVPCFQKA
jgi:hypothetical protein